MTTLSELVQLEPPATAGRPIQFAHDVGLWRLVYELADPLAGSSVEWHDFTDRCMGHNLTRGAAGYAGRYRACVATLEVRASDDSFAPYNDDTSATFGTHVELGSGLLVRAGLIRVFAGEVVEWIPRFTCKVERWGDASYGKGKVRRHLVIARDTMTSLVNVPVAASGEEPFIDRVAYVLAQAGWPYGTFTFYDDVITVPARAEQVSAINELDATIDPTGLVWYTDRRGIFILEPRPGDTLHTGALTKPEYWFHYLASPSTSNLISFAMGQPAEPFGLSKTEDGVINHVRINSPGGIYDNDNPTSIQRFDRKTYQATWIAENDQAALDILNYRANAQMEATPIATSIDRPGFWDALQLDYLSRVRVDAKHGPALGAIAAVGGVRHIEEHVSPRKHGASVNFDLKVILDVESYETSQSLLPVEDLALSDIWYDAAEWNWTNPGGQPVAPTNTQVRIPELSSIWVTIGYPLTVHSWGTLEPGESYTFQIRLVVIDDGLVTAFSPTRQLEFTTLSDTDVPGPGGPGGVDVPIGECLSTQWELQQFNEDGTTGWQTIASGTTSTTPVDVSAHVEPGGNYRMRTNRCGEGWVTGPSWIEPDDWGDACMTPPAFADAPFDDPDLVAYVPKICSPNTITEAVSGNAATKGPAFAAITNIGGQPTLFSGAEGTVAFGFGTAIELNALVGDATLNWKGRLGEQPDAMVVLADFAGMQIRATASGAGFEVSGRAIEEVGGATTITGSTELDLDEWYNIALVHDTVAGTLELFVEGASEADTTGVGERTSASSAAWFIELPNDSYVTDVALWARALDPSELPTEGPGSGGLLYDAIVAKAPLVYLPMRETSGTAIADLGSLGLGGTVIGTATLPLAATAGPDGFSYPQGVLVGGAAGIQIPDNAALSLAAAGGLTVVMMVKLVNTTNTQRTLIKKSQEWRIMAGAFVDGSQVYAQTLRTTDTVARTVYTGTGVLSTSSWKLLAVRYGPGNTDYPSVRVNGVNQSVTNFITQTAGGDTANPVWVFTENSGTTSQGEQYQAHLAIFAGQLSDSALSDIEAAADAEGWY